MLGAGRGWAVLGSARLGSASVHDLPGLFPTHDYAWNVTAPHAKVLIIMPAYNEQGVVGQVAAETLNALPGVDVLVVSDGSRDGTAAEARAAGALVLELPVNLGVGGAMRAGFKFALRGGYDVAVQVDADGQHNPLDVPRLVEQLDEHDLVIGARFAGVGDYSVSGPRKWAMKFLSGVLSRTGGVRLTDTTSGFKAVGPRALELFAEEFPAEYLGDTIEALVIAQRAGLRICQVPVTMRPRAGGVPSQGGWKLTVYLVRAILALALAFLRPSPKLTPMLEETTA